MRCVAVLPPPADAARVSCLLAEHLRWSAWWDKKYRLWRVADDDPDSDLYAESSDADEVIGYVVGHALPATVGGRAVLDVLNDDRVL